MKKEPTLAEAELPRAKSRTGHRNFSVIWLVPIVAALVAGYLVYTRVREFGSTITVSFRNAEGLKQRQTTLHYRGVVIGQVSSVELSKDQQYAVVTIRLRRAAAAVAREGSTFWIVQPELELGNISGLGTLLSGPHIEVSPGGGASRSQFVGAERSPVTLEPHGLRIVLLSGHAGSLRAGVPVYYRGIPVGAVQDSRLASNATTAEISVVIKQRFAPLVRGGSKFWNVTGLDVKFGIFRGAEINVDSLKSLVIGGIAFATPDDSKKLERVTDGTIFRLYDNAQPDWLEWSPALMLGPDPPDDSPTDPPETARPPLGLPRTITRLK